MFRVEFQQEVCECQQHTSQWFLTIASCGVGAVGPFSETDGSQLQHLQLLAVSEWDLLLGCGTGHPL
jgi:hypothetical protein